MSTLPERAKIRVKPNINRTFFHHETSCIISCVCLGIQAFIETRDDRMWKHIEHGKFIDASLLSNPLSKPPQKMG